jgi:hypothetical protein
MNASTQTVHKDAGTGGITGVLRNSFQAGLGVAENMHRFAVEIPLNMLPTFGVSEETTTELKDKHRNLLRGMYGSINSVATRLMDVGGKQEALVTAELKNLVETQAEEADEADAEEAPATLGES